MSDQDLPELPSANIIHDDNRMTTVYRAPEHGELKQGTVMAVVDGEGNCEFVPLTDRRWYTHPVVFLNHKDFDDLEQTVPQVSLN